jgi:hypothetical protein
MNRRPAATLMEVLVAIFVTAIGLLALLALFPLGALSMAQAIKDGRTAHATANAERNAVTLNVRQDPQLLTNSQLVLTPGTAIPAVFANPNFGTQNPSWLPPADPDGPSYPVFVDPIGWQAFSVLPNWARLVGGTPGIPRRNLDFIERFTVPPLPPGSPISAFRTRHTLNRFTLGDDIAFLQPDPANPQNDAFIGLPCPPPTPTGGGVVTREGRYSWAYLLKRPRTADASVDLTVVVYSQRPIQLGGSLVPQGETVYTTPPNFLPANRAGSVVVTLTWGPGQEKPAIRRNGWILDASREIRTLTLPNGSTTLFGTAHGVFYRVLDVVEPGQVGVNSIDVEIQGVLRHDIMPVNTGSFQCIPQIVVMENVVEVFEKGTGW